MTALAVGLFAAAAGAEIGGAFLIWRGIREGAGWQAGLAGGALLVVYGLLAALQPLTQFGRVFAAYGGVFVAGSLLWAVWLDGFRPDQRDLAGAAVCLVGSALIAGPHRG